jgi:hypothetical protein
MKDYDKHLEDCREMIESIEAQSTIERKKVYCVVSNESGAHKIQFSSADKEEADKNLYFELRYRGEVSHAYQKPYQVLFGWIWYEDFNHEYRPEIFYTTQQL